MQITVIIPSFNDWESIDLLLQDLDLVLGGCEIPVEVLVIDDGSTVSMPSHIASNPLKAISAVDVLRLRRNLGHQRAIAIGLAFAQANRPCEAVVVMDADGEDRPSDVPRLLQRFYEEGGKKIIFAERTRRSENRIFTLFYHFYRVLHRILTGVSIRVGSFSIVPFSSLASLVVAAELWNHYAAAVITSRLPYATIPSTRGSRISGHSKMNFIALVIHGLSAISVYGDVVAVRLLGAATGLIVLFATSLFVAVIIRFATDLAIPGWATFTSGILLIILLQIVTMAFLLIFMILNSRANLTFVPVRDYQYFVRCVRRVFPQ